MQKSNDFSPFELFFGPLTTIKAITLLIIVGIVVFFNSFFNYFLWDDISLILNNVGIHSFNFFTGFDHKTALFFGYFRPIYFIYFSFLYPIFQDNTFFYHLIQVSFHILNSILIFIFFKKIINKYISFFLSLVFLVHPINVETTVYISAVLYPLLSIFGLLSLVKLQKQILTNKEYISIGIMLFLSLITKEEGILYILIAFIFCLLLKRTHLKNLTIAGGLATIIYGLIRFITGNFAIENGNFLELSHQGFMERLFNIPAIFFYYIMSFFFPKDISLNQTWVVHTIDLSSFYLPLFFDSVFFFILFLAGFYVYKKNKNNITIFIFFLIWFLLGILMHLQIIPLDMIAADRWFYFSIIGLLGMGGLLIQEINISNKNIKFLLFLIGTIALVLLSLRTMVRNTNWHDEITLFEHDSQVSTTRQTESLLGKDYLDIRDYKSSLRHFKKALELSPDEAAYLNVGVIYLKQNNYNEAISYFKKSIKTNYLPKNSHQQVIIISYGYLAICEYKMNNREDALNAIKKARSMSSTSDFIDNLYQNILNNRPIDQ